MDDTRLANRKSISRAKLSTNKLLRLSRFGLDGRASQAPVLRMTVSDRSIYNDLPLVYTPPRMDRRYIPHYENTYKMVPQRIPHHYECHKFLVRVVNSYVNYQTKYHPKDAEDIVRKISVNVKRAVKGMGLPRYKVLSVTTLGEKNEQCLIAQCKFLWDADLDIYSTYTFENQYLFVISTVYVIYYE